MRAEYINPFIRSISNTFDTMLGCQITRGTIFSASDKTNFHEVSGVIGLSGMAAGMVIVSMSKEVALKAASTMLMTEYTEINEDVIDAAGEITNMVAGAAKAELEEYNLSIGLPNVITGDTHQIQFASNVTPICVPFDTPWGNVLLEVGLEVVSTPTPS
ncbi:MAG: chemotaxis protein CheX [Pirellulaceae bacterium]|nr:chemotaxis protein CheX [Pirellulaceae bacterium]